MSSSYAAVKPAAFGHYEKVAVMTSAPSMVVVSLMKARLSALIWFS